jgi:DNA-binding NarL/FixJ family response regulator
VFEVHRAAAWPLTGVSPNTAFPPADDAPDDVDRAVLALMQAGLTDVIIARQVGIAPRSLQRRLQRLMRLAAARSRFQLGIHAAQSGWLP